MFAGSSEIAGLAVTEYSAGLAPILMTIESVQKTGLAEFVVPAIAEQAEFAVTALPEQPAGLAVTVELVVPVEPGLAVRAELAALVAPEELV